MFVPVFYLLLNALTHVLGRQVIADYFQRPLAIRFIHSEEGNNRGIRMAGMISIVEERSMKKKIAAGYHYK